MKLKYYLRGLGIGVVVTSLIMGITSHGASSMSDEEIRSRAMELGMIEEGTLLSETKAASQNAADEAEAAYLAKEVLEQNKTATVSADTISENQVSQNQISANTVSQPVVDHEVSTVSVPQVGTKADEAEDGQANKSVSANSQSTGRTTGKTVDITISSGQSSISIAMACEAAGLIEDAAEFDHFLMTSGYDRHLATGVHPIPQGASEDEIGNLLTHKQ